LLGPGFTKCEIFFEKDFEQEILAKTEATGLLLKDFDPTAVPAHNLEGNRDTYVEHFVSRRARIYQNARFGLMKTAALGGCNAELQQRIREKATGRQLRRDEEEAGEVMEQ